MRRDPWMIRDLLRKSEDGSIGTLVADDPDGKILYHTNLLLDGGFFSAGLVLTWKGAELLDLCRNGDRFKSAVNQVQAEIGGANFELLTELLSNPVHD